MVNKNLPWKKGHYPVHCPVCKVQLGDKQPWEVLSVRCQECRAEFTFYKPNIKPTVLTDRQKDNICDCMSCQYRDGRPSFPSSL